jgi:hypothetical protein
MLRSRKVSAPPMIRPAVSLSRAVDTLTGMRTPSPSTIKPDLLITGSPVARVCFMAQSTSHMLARKTSEQGRPMASFLGMPVICSAARLNSEMRHFSSMVNTPSEMLSRITAAASGEICGFAAVFTAISSMVGLLTAARIFFHQRHYGNCDVSVCSLLNENMLTIFKIATLK